MPSPNLLVALIGALSLATPLKAARKCYWADGTEADGSQQPCNPEATFSACCALNQTRPDICLSSGLCYAQEEGHEGMIYSRGCTDPTGQAEECPRMCSDRASNWNAGQPVRSYNVLQCETGNMFCCRSASTNANCCGDKSAVWRINIGQLQTKSLETGMASATCDAMCSDAQFMGECPKDRAAVVGGAVGGVLGAALIASLGVIAVLCRRRLEDHNTVIEPREYSHAAPSAQELSGRSVHEMQGSEAYLYKE